MDFFNHIFQQPISKNKKSYSGLRNNIPETFSLKNIFNFQCKEGVHFKIFLNFTEVLFKMKIKFGFSYANMKLHSKSFPKHLFFS